MSDPPLQNIVYLYFSWTDPRAKQEVIDTTDKYRNGTLETCERPCFTSVVQSRDAEGTTSRFSSSSNESLTGLPFHFAGYIPEYSCCDTVWLPSIRMMNAYELPEGRLQPYGIRVDPGGSGAVGWWTALQAVYFTPMLVSL